MLNFKRILVPYDGSEHAKKAVRQAVSIAECTEDAVLYVISIDEDISALDMNNLERAYMNEQLQAVHSSPAKTHIQDAKGMIPPSVKAEYTTRTGDAGPLLESFAREKNCDLVVMGSRGLGALSGLVMGSVSNYLAAHIACPIFIIR